MTNFGSDDDQIWQVPNLASVGPVSEPDILASVANKLLGDLSKDKVMMREGKLQCGEQVIHISNALLDTGASMGNYAGSAIAERFNDIEREPCFHRVQLGDGKTVVQCTEMITLDVSLYAPDGTLQAPISTVFYIMPALGERLIIGLPEILGNFYDYFTTILEDARNRRPKARIERVSQLYGLCKDQICSPTPNKKLLLVY